MSNWMLDVEKLVRELRRQKQKYHAKVLSDSAIAILWQRTLDIEDILPFWVWLYIPEINFSDFAFSLLFDIPPIEFEPINLEFSVELPSIDEFMQGILVDISKYDISKEFKWLKTIDDFVFENIDTKYASTMSGSRLRKGVYGVSRYGYSYYDPPAVREFLRSTFVKLWVERKTLVQLRSDMEATARSLNINPDFARFVFTKISIVSTAQPSAMILGYGVLGYSYLGKRVGDKAELVFIDYDMNVRKYYAQNLDQIQYGFILDVTPLNCGYLMPEETVYKKVEREMPARVALFSRHLGSPDVSRFIERKGLRIMFSFRYTPLAFANYQRPEERRDYLKSERADQWMTLQLIRYIVENIVDSIVRNYESNPVRIRMYKSATLQLISAKAKRHRWGYKGFEAMSEDEFREWWVRHWVAQGLKEEVLRELYNRLEPWLREWRNLKYQLGKRLREVRYRLAHLS